MKRASLLRRVALAFGLIGAGIGAWYAFAVPKTLKVAVGPVDSPQHRFVQAMARALRDTSQSYKLELVAVADSAAAAGALDRRKVDLAVLRSDDPTSTEARSIAVLQRRQMVIVARKGGGVETVADLKGRATAVLNSGSESNRGILDRILQHYEMDARQLAIEELSVDQLDKVEKQHDAWIVLVNPASGGAKAVLDAITRKAGAELVFAGMPGPDGLALRLRDLSKSTVAAGVFGGTPPSPEEALPTVAVSYELVATSDLGQTDAKDLLTALVEVRTRLRKYLPRTTFDVEAPPVDEQRRFLAHLGAAAYVNDEDVEGFLETYSDQIWIGLFTLSILGSSIAGWLGWTGYFDAKPTAMRQVEDRLRALATSVGAATTEAELDAARTELDAILVGQLGDSGVGSAATAEGMPLVIWISALGDLIDRRRAKAPSVS